MKTRSEYKTILPVLIVTNKTGKIVLYENTK